jgi:hypothetical protein
MAVQHKNGMFVDLSISLMVKKAVVLKNNSQEFIIAATVDTNAMR